MRIRILDKASGRTGTVPEEEFDATKYTKIDDSGNIVHTPIVDTKPTTLGNIVQGPAAEIASAQADKAKRDEEAAMERKIFQGAVVPAAQIAGGLIGGPGLGGIIGAGLGGVVGESTRQYQGGEEANLGNIVKEGAIGAGTQYLGGKLGEFLTKGKGAEKVAAATKEPSGVSKLGTKLKQSKFNPEAKIKGELFDSEKVIRRQATLDNPAYGLSDAPTAKVAREIVDKTYGDASKAAGEIIKSSVRPVDAQRIIPEVEGLLKNVRLDRAAREEGNFLYKRIVSAPDDATLYKIMGDLKATLGKSLEKGAVVNSKVKAVQEAFHNTLNNYLKEIPEAKSALTVMQDMHEITPVVASGVTSAAKGIKVPLISKVTGPLPGGELAQKAATKVGGMLEKVGGGLPSATGLGLPPITGSLIAPAMQVGAANMGGLPSPQPVETTSTSTEQAPQPETTQYVTGYSPEELMRMRIKAKNAGDTASVSEIEKLYNYETAYQKEKVAKDTKTMAEKANDKVTVMVDKAIKDVQSGKVRTGIVAGPLESFKAKFNIADQPTLDFQKLSSIIKSDIVKAKAGTALTPTEERMINEYVPLINDSTQNVITKLKTLQETATLIKQKYQKDTLPDIPQ